MEFTRGESIKKGFTGVMKSFGIAERGVAKRCWLCIRSACGNVFICCGIRYGLSVIKDGGGLLAVGEAEFVDGVAGS